MLIDSETSQKGQGPHTFQSKLEACWRSWPGGVGMSITNSRLPTLRAYLLRTFLGYGWNPHEPLATEMLAVPGSVTCDPIPWRYFRPVRALSLGFETRHEQVMTISFPGDGRYLFEETVVHAVSAMVVRSSMNQIIMESVIYCRRKGPNQLPQSARNPPRECCVLSASAVIS